MYKSHYSAGGVVVDGRKVLLISVKKIGKKKIWTFPKGHIEKGETPRQAAAREVEEETGYRCSVFRSLLRVGYFFTIGRQKVKKTVKWFLMRPNMKAGKPDTSEIVGIIWVSFDKARSMLYYQTDLELVDLARKATQR